MGEEPAVEIQARWDYDDEGARRLMSDIDSAATKTEESHYKMDRSSVRLARSTAHLSMMFGNLYGMTERLASGQLDIVRSLPMLIGYFISLASTIYTVVAAEKTRAIAHAIANAVSSMGVAVPIMIAAAAAAAAGIAAIAIASGRQAGGPIFRTGYYKLEHGEVYKPGAGGGINIIVTGNTITQDTLPLVSRKLVLDLQASGVM